MKRRAFLAAAPALMVRARAAASVPLHGLFERRFEANIDPATEAVAEIRGPDGGHAVRLFPDGPGHWVFRFSPERPGSYRYRIAAHDKSLAGRTGGFSCGGLVGSTDLDRRGAPRIAAGARHFTHADGTPWFWLCDTAWNGALLATTEEWDDYLRARAAQRFTAAQFVLTQWRAGRADEEGRVAFQVEDGRLALFPEFFRRLDRRFAAMRRHGLVPVPVMLWALTSGDKESPGETLDARLAIQLASYLNARYHAYGPLWFLGGDGDYRGERAQRWREIGRAVFPSHLDRRPVSLHPRGMQDPWPGLKDEPWLDFLSYQSGHGDSAAKWRWQVERGLALGWKLSPPRPVLDAEPDYEGHVAYDSRQVITAATVRRAVYSSLFAAPPAGVTYGAHGVWFWARQDVVPLDHASTGVAKPWRECLTYPGAAQMKVMRDLFDRFPWHEMQPAPDLVAAHRPNDAYSNPLQALATPDGATAVLYLPDQPAEPIRPPASCRATWLDPRTGAETPAAGELRPPGPGDWLLLLVRT